MIEPKIVTLEPRLLVGLSTTMSLANNKTAELWRSFMPRRQEVAGRVSGDYISMQVYDISDQSMFRPDTEFVKWATVEVDSHNSIPEGMAAYTLEGGLYALFNHKGPASSAPQIMGYIFGEWLPRSAFELDHREHFEILPEGYNPLDPEAEEEILIPIKKERDMSKHSIEVYDAIIALHPDIERKGKNMLYTSANGYMFSMVNKDGEIGIRLPDESGKKFMEAHQTTRFKSHGAFMRGYVLVPESLYDNVELLSEYLGEGYQYVMSLPPKAGKKK